MRSLRRTACWVRAGGSGPWALAAAVTLAVMVAPLGVAATGDALRESVRNGTSSQETEIIGQFNATDGPKGGYVTRQSNTQTGPNAGGGAIYGCRGAAGGTAAGSAPCLRATNLADGYAFELASGGSVGGLITLGDPTVPNPGRPFVTNATGVATGLNADQVDGLDAGDLAGGPGPEGPQGPPGPEGPQGPAGSDAPPSDVRVETLAGANVPTCNGADPGACNGVATIGIPQGSWLLQAKLTIDNNAPAASSIANRCGLSIGPGVLDQARHALSANGSPGQTESVALTAVREGPGPTFANVRLRCTEQSGENLRVEDVTLTALEIGAVTGS